ncbi:hypothetical protein OIE52_46640 [Streptomyces canus]|uniref:hypothetical protein n=1 Tax=Streptomyces canus TaxID=58343 RepID=UPI002E2CC9A4|nr:hypothetical protein [Streptomyces canus]
MDTPASHHATAGKLLLVPEDASVVTLRPEQPAEQHTPALTVAPQGAHPDDERTLLTRW